MSSANYQVTWNLEAKDNASAAMSSVMQVMRNGTNVSAQTMQQFKQTTQSVNSQTRAMSVLRNEWNADNPAAMQLSRSLSNIGSIGSTVLSIVNSLMLAQLSMATTQATLAGAQQNVKDSQIQYNQAVAQYGPNSLQALQALQQLHQAQNQLTQDQAQATRQNQELDLQYAGIGLTLAGTGAQVISAIKNFTGLSQIMGAAGVATDTETAMTDAFALSEDEAAVSTGGLSAAGIFYSAQAALASAASAAWTGIQWLLNAALDANPIGLVALAIGGLIALIAYVTDGFRNWTPIVNALNLALKDLYGFLNWLLQPFGGVTGAMNDLKAAGQALFAVFDWYLTGEIKIWMTALTDFWNLIQPIVKGIQTIAGGVSAVSNAIGNNSTVQSAGSSISSGLSTAWNDITHFAGGGVVSSPTLAVVGEAGPEAVVPLGSGAGGGGGGPTIIVNVQGSVTTLNELTDNIDRVLYQRYSRLRRS